MKSRRRLDWVNTIFMTASPVLAVGLTAYYLATQGLHWGDAALFFVMYILTGMGITAGYHRYYSHRAYDCHWTVQLFYLIFGAAAIENSALKWCRDHRIHHQKVDSQEDPYNIKEGFFYAHIGWIFFKTPAERDFSTVPDLRRDKLVRWQHRYYLPILVIVGFGIPTLIGAAYGRPLGGFLFGGLVRAVFVQHMTFLINSAAHYFGKRPYSVDNTARDSWWLAFFTYGEGYHNYHHRFGADYRNGIRWYQFDPTKWFIRTLSYFGLAWRLTKFREEHILKARIEADMRRVQMRLEGAPEELYERMQKRMADAKLQLETAYARLDEAKTRYKELKRSVVASSENARMRWTNAKAQWKLRSRQYNFQFQAAQARWALMIAAFSRFQMQNPMN
jgi:stearoyl-CoA desaturase (delta-9 desaturase)